MYWKLPTFWYYSLNKWQYNSVTVNIKTLLQNFHMDLLVLQYLQVKFRILLGEKCYIYVGLFQGHGVTHKILNDF